MRNWVRAAVVGTLLATALVGVSATPAQAVIGSWLPVHGGVWSSSNPTLGGTVYALAVSDDTLYVGGAFGRVGRADDSIAANNIAAYNLRTDTWHALGSQPTPGVTGTSGIGTVRAIVIHPVDDTVYFGGDFLATSDSSTTLNRIAQWNGSSILPLGPGLDNPVYALELSNRDDTVYALDDTLYIGGAFQQTAGGGVNLNYIAQWGDDTFLPLATGLSRPSFASAPVYALAMRRDAVLHTDDTLYLGGDFTQTQTGTALNYLAQWVGGAFRPLGPVGNPGLTAGGGTAVTSLAVRDDSLYFGGDFTQTRTGTTLNYIGQWADDTFLPLGSGLSAPGTDALALASDDSLYAGGRFTTNFTRVAQWDGSAFAAMGGGLSDAVRALAVTDDTVFAGGAFGAGQSISGTQPRGLAMWAPGVAPTVTVTYLANLGSGAPPSPQSGTQGSSITVAGPGALTRAGYAFAGWNTQPNGNGTPYAVGSNFVLGGSNSNLFAQWVSAAPPDPTPSYPPSPPVDVSATGGDASVLVSWKAPSSSGSYPISNYRATASPGGGTCLTSAESRECTIDELTNGTTYTVTVAALNGAGWSADSAPSARVTPTPRPVVATIVITGSRGADDASRVVYVKGSTTGLAGATVQARVRLAGQQDYADGSTRVVASEESFTWQRRTGKRLSVYFNTSDGIRSNTVAIGPAT